jgi:hypothetical protein
VPDRAAVASRLELTLDTDRAEEDDHVDAVIFGVDYVRAPSRCRTTGLVAAFLACEWL